MSPGRRRALLLLAIGAAAPWTRAHEAARSPALQALLARATQRLRAGDGAEAERLFDDAALQAHAADIECGQVRAQMQQGHYRRALAYAAHVAGVHADEPEGVALYAWLLSAGGQPALALRLLEGALAKEPSAPLRAAHSALAQAPCVMPAGLPLGPLHDEARGQSAAGHCATVLDAHTALAPAEVLAAGPALRLRDAAGRVLRVRAERLSALPALARLTPERPLDIAPAALAARAPFPGSPLAAFTLAADLGPAWPWLRLGFAGGLDGNSGQRRLGVEWPAGPRGGPVTELGGALLGIALRGGAGEDRLVTIDELRSAGLLPTSTAPAPSPRLSPDALYERWMGRVLQVLPAAG